MTRSGSGAKVLKGRPYFTPICNVGFLYNDEDGYWKAAAIDARRRTGQRRHDMAARAIRTLMQYSSNN